MKKAVLWVTLAGLWITASEFVRNQFLFKRLWIDHFRSLGLAFETKPLNGILWMVWSFLLAYLLFRLLAHLRLGHAVILAWLAAFVMMWITVYNLGVLPLKLLFAAVPLSLLEAAVAAWIVRKAR